MMIQICLFILKKKDHGGYKEFNYIFLRLSLPSFPHPPLFFFISYYSHTYSYFSLLTKKKNHIALCEIIHKYSISLLPQPHIHKDKSCDLFYGSPSPTPLFFFQPKKVYITTTMIVTQRIVFFSCCLFNVMYTSPFFYQLALLFYIAKKNKK